MEFKMLISPNISRYGIYWKNNERGGKKRIIFINQEIYQGDWIDDEAYESIEKRKLKQLKINKISA